MLRRQWLIARTIFVEALRRREIYAIVLITAGMLLLASLLRFFDLQGLHKFYHEVSLKVMTTATVLTVIVLAARQLPREFERRTIYTLLAKPIARWEFLLGKYVGVVLAGLFCLGLFMGVFCLGRLFTQAPLDWRLFGQFLFMQGLAIGCLAALSFLLSMLMGLDAAIVTAMLIYLLGQVMTNAMTVVYEFTGAAGRAVLITLNYLVPQPALFDLSAKVVHEWPPVPAWVLGLATLYCLMFVIPYLGLSYALFRRRAL
ncbi:MAG TPA: ABC transporter permease [Candidatus Sumerlaeota bacterium]|mgnify:CR=1 FL=1|nr:MAG: ABC-2 family transporter protein [candidate division BRC1 bacterium ADurb.BinA292]HOE96513.1 ABC transporter permease [Candidatus Sumerlaeota bacterium]HOR28028.1 ABC transporter permease [Candidatus Sumerlaeota bacterium]HPK01785.1 ABC transporter permease [Candidatus Sumerlaeota bacterium]